MILIKQCDVFAPEKLGKKDVLLGEEKILAVENDIKLPETLDVEVVKSEGMKLMPGLIDGHVHINGAGGEGGPQTRTPELRLSQMLSGGITTVVGLMGTDGFTRYVESVLMKAKSLRAQGVSAWVLTGAYQVPPPTILGSVARDITLIEEVIGVGEIAVADHRSSSPSVEEIIRLAGEARLAGMLAGKCGILNLHMGDAKNPFDIIYRVVENSELNFSQFLPTHCNRNEHILKEAVKYGEKGYIDVTAYPPHYKDKFKASRAIAYLNDAGVPLKHITMTSDGCGSLPVFDKKGNLLKLEPSKPENIFKELLNLVKREDWPWEMALKVVTENVADRLKLHNKGRITTGKDADVLILDQKDRIYHLLARGTWMIKDGKIKKKDPFYT